MKNNTEPGFFRYLSAKAMATHNANNGTFELTARCNFNCKMCYVHQQNADKSKELSTEEWLNIASESASRGLFFLLLTGGEPLLRQDFEELYRKFKEMGLLVSVNTNGFLINEKTKELFKKYPPRRLNISLYAADNETYESICGVSAFDTVSKNIEDLNNDGVKLKINMSSTVINKKDVDKIYEFSKKLNVPLTPAGYMFPPARIENTDAQFVRMGAKEYAQFEFEHLKRYKSPEELLVYAKNIFENAPQQRKSDEAEILPCRAGKCAYWITWDGKMLPCGMMTEPIADVRALGYEEAWKRINQSISDVRLPIECSDCKYRCTCNICAAKCICETGSFSGVPEYVCEAAKEKYRLLKNVIASYGG